MDTLIKIAKLLLGSVTAKVLQLVFFFWVAKLLDIDQFGQYVVSMTLFLVLMFPILEFGSELLINREEAQGNREAFFQIGYWKLITFPMAAIIGILIGRLIFNLDTHILALSAFFVFLKSLESGNAACLRGKNRSEIESVHLVCSRTISIMLLIVTTIFAPDTLTVELAILFQIIGILISIIVVEKNVLLDIPMPSLNIKELGKILKLGFPLALNSVAWLIYFKIDVLLISKMINTSAAGTYEIAYKILEATFILPGVIMAVMYRQLAHQQDRTKTKQLFLYTTIALSITGCTVAISSILLLPYIFPLIFSHHHGVTDVYRLLAVVIPIVYLAHLTTQTLVLQNQTYVYLGITLTGAAINFCLNIYFINSHGLLGAAIATIITELFILLVSSWIVYKHSEDNFTHPDSINSDAHCD